MRYQFRKCTSGKTSQLIRFTWLSKYAFWRSFVYFQKLKTRQNQTPKYRIPNSVRSVWDCTGMSGKIITVQYGWNTHVQIVQCLKKCFPLSTDLLIWSIVSPSFTVHYVPTYLFVCADPNYTFFAFRIMVQSCEHHGRWRPNINVFRIARAEKMFSRIIMH